MKNSLSKLLLVIIFFVLLVAYFISLDQYQNIFFTGFILILNLLSLIIYVLRKESLEAIRRQYIRISTLFLLGYIIVFFQLHVDYLFGNLDGSYSRFWVNLKIVPKALVLSSLGFNAFLLGLCYKNQFQARTPSTNYYKYPLFGFKILAFCLLGTMIATINPLFLRGGYGNFDMGTTARYSSILFELTITAHLAQLVINLKAEKIKNLKISKFIKKIGFFQLILISIYFSTIIISGDRGPVIYLSLAIISSYIILTKFKVPRLLFLLLIFTSSIIISGFVVIRNNDDKTTPIIYQISDAILSEHKAYRSLEGVNSISDPTLELATSVRTLHNAVNHIPSKEPFYYGQFQLLQLASIVPLGQLFIQQVFDIKDHQLTSAKYLTYLIGGQDGGEGTSCVADLYLDFGVLGVILGLFLFGVFVRFLESTIFQENYPSLIVLVAYIVFCQYAIYIPRATILFNIRNLIWILVIIYFVRILSKPFKLRNEINN